MSQQGYSIGRDTTVVFIKPDGTSLRFGKLTGFKSKPDTSNQKIKGLDGINDNLRYHEGWSGSFAMERRSADVDDYFAAVERNYHAGLDEPPGTIIQTISEPDGSVSQYRFERAVLNLDDAGDWAADKTVAQSISFMSSKRIQQA